MIELNQIKKCRFDRVILNSINVTFLDNQHYVILGESGSGKTTLLNIIAGYEQADKGNINIEKEAKIEYLFQDNLLFSNISVEHNMLIKWLSNNKITSKKEFEEKCMDALKLFSIEQFVNSKIYTLSGGEKRRVELAQIFLSKPNILLLDEPTANLDSNNKGFIIDTIRKNFKNTIVIIVSHDDKKYFSNFKLLNLKEGGLYFE